MSECARCGLPIEKMAHFIMFDDEVYCETCFEEISKFREDRGCGMTEKRFENRLNKNNVKFNTLNPVWDNEKQDALNVFEMMDMLNHLHEENNKLRFQLNLCSDQRNEFHRGARENANRVGKLEKENEQLKSENEWLKSIHFANDVLKENKELKSFIKSLASPDGRIWLDNGYGYRINKILNDFNNTENDDGDVE